MKEGLFVMTYDELNKLSYTHANSRHMSTEESYIILSKLLSKFNDFFIGDLVKESLVYFDKDFAILYIFLEKIVIITKLIENKILNVKILKTSTIKNIEITLYEDEEFLILVTFENEKIVFKGKKEDIECIADFLCKIL